MFKNLSSGINKALTKVKGQGRLTQDNLSKIISEIQDSLLDADVNIDVAQNFITKIKNDSLNTSVLEGLNPANTFVKIVYDELTRTLGNDSSELNIRVRPPAVILVAGLQGAGKTTTSAKLAKYITDTLKKKVVLTSTDVYRPAALSQLETLAQQLGLSTYIPTTDMLPLDIVSQSLQKAKQSVADVLIIDTAGRMHIDNSMMQEIAQIHKASKPVETFFVVDSMTGQDAANTAKAFGDILDLTGVILTKTDGDSRGGAALSVSHVCGCPIKFMGTGEKVSDFEMFHPDRVAKRILGMGDIMSLIETAEQKIDEKRKDKLRKSVTKGKFFNFNDLREQLKQMNEMGGMEKIMQMMPNIPNLNQNALSSQKSHFAKSLAMIDSMTKAERKHPKLLDASRKKRIADGSGNTVQEINTLIKQLANMQKMMKKFSKGKKMLNMLRGNIGKFPTGMM